MQQPGRAGSVSDDGYFLQSKEALPGIADGLDKPVPATINDAGVLDVLTPDLRPKGERDAP